MPNQTEKDDFWDIGKLVPNNKKPANVFSSGAHFAEVTDAGDAPSASPLTFADRAREGETFTYVPLGAGFLRLVTVKKFADRYDFYDAFRKSALLYYDMEGQNAPFTPFYSYLPQYSQLSREQKDYYFWFRSCVRRGEMIQTDYSYLYLLVYEILNLPEKYPPDAALATLLLLWRSYRKALPRIDRFFAVWVQDYCLVYKLPAPFAAVSDFLPDIITVSTLKEFWMSADAESKMPATSLIARLSDYDYRTCRYAGGATKDAYRRYMEEAMSAVFEALFRDGMTRVGKEAVLVRDAFPYSLCTHSVKCRLEVRYTALTEDPALRRTVTAAVRYTENCLRAALSVKSRISVRDLPPDIKDVVDAYFAGVAAAKKKNAPAPAAPAWEKQYEAEAVGLSSEESDRIERSSWTTTARLVPEEELEAEESALPPKTEPPRQTADAHPEAAYLRAILSNDTLAAGAAVRNAGVPEQTLAERINLIFIDLLGDVVLEAAETGFTLIEDYREDVEEWLKQQK